LPDGYRVAYRVEADRSIVDVLEESWFLIGTWEAAPFVRVE
jgi:hypothetical protein